MPTFDFGDGPVPAHRYINRDGTEGGWVADTATITRHNVYIGAQARVSKYARISNEAQILGGHITDFSHVSGHARIEDDVLICEYAKVNGFSIIRDNVRVSGRSVVSGDARISGNAFIGGGARIDGNARVADNVIVGGNAIVMGNSQLQDNVQVGWGAHIDGNASASGNAIILGRLMHSHVTKSPFFAQVGTHRISQDGDILHIDERSYTLVELSSRLLKNNLIKEIAVDPDEIRALRAILSALRKLYEK